MLGGLPWVLLGLAAAFGLAGVHYYGWVFGIREKLSSRQRTQMHSTMARLRGHHSERNPADDVQQALHDVLKGAPDLGETPDDDLWIPEVRTPTAHRQRDAS